MFYGSSIIILLSGLDLTVLLEYNESSSGGSVGNIIELGRPKTLLTPNNNTKITSDFIF